MLSDPELVTKINNLPSVQLNYDWEKNFFAHKSDIEALLKSKGINESKPFRYEVPFNRISAVTGVGYYYVYVISLNKSKSLRIEGDDLWLIEKSKKSFSAEDRKTLNDILSK